ncbi:MAG: hypothetical protein KTR18_09320 [Acidiferrobacterales bacterium]|nr:hypothetical protein [Acidiferrobacterales bacterium]
MKSRTRSGKRKGMFTAAGYIMFGTLISSGTQAACQPFLVESNNGEGGFRFMHDVKNFRPVASGSRYEAVICDRRSFQVELAKKNIGARVRFSIDGKPYEFSQGDAGDKNLKSWYRKYFDIQF